MAAGRFLKPKFMTEATVWIEAQDGRDAGPIRSGQLLGSSGWVELMNSYTVLDYAVRQLRLYLIPDSPADSAVFRSFRVAESFVPGRYGLSVGPAGETIALTASDGTALEQVPVADSLGRSLGFAWVPDMATLRPGQTVEFSVRPPRDAARDVAERLRAQSARDGNLMRVQLVGTEPRTMTATLNAVVNRFVDVAAELKRARLTEYARILDEQLDQAERNLREAEMALEGFRVHTITLPSERATPIAPGIQQTRDPAFGNFVEMKVEWAQLDRDREAIDRALAQTGDSGLSVAALEAVPVVQRSRELTNALGELTGKRVELRTLRYQYTNDHPAVRRMEVEVRALEKVTIPVLANQLLDEVGARQAELDSRIRSASQELQQIPRRAIQEARLNRDVTVAENLFTTLQQRYEQARLAEASSIPDVRILDAAVVPARPISNQTYRLIVMGFMGGLGLGLVGALTLDRVDRRVRYPDQVTAQLGLPLLGAVPHLKGGRNGPAFAGPDGVIEALRGVRLNLVHAYGAAGPVLVTVTSPEPGDGKSFVAANLALAFGSAGHRSLLIDGDSRRGLLHRRIGVPRKPGLTDALMGNVPRANVVRPTKYHSVHFVSCGTRAQQAPELFGSGAMVEFISGLRSSYGAIIIDSPPLGAGIDALALGTVTGNVLLVLRLGATNRELAEAKLDVLDRLPIRVLGAVLNDVRSRDVYQYYSYGMSGYEHDEEGEVEDQKRLESGRKA